MGQIGVCSGGDGTDYTVRCRVGHNVDDCSLFQTCENDYGACLFWDSVRRSTFHELCDWAVNPGQEHWRTEAGGTDETAQYVADVIGKTWLDMRLAHWPTFEQTGTTKPLSAASAWPDIRVCVGTGLTPACLRDQTKAVIGGTDPAEAGPLPGSLSDWSPALFVTDLVAVDTRPFLRFAPKFKWPGAQDVKVACNPPSSKDLDVALGTSTDEERAALEALTGTLFEAFIEEKKVQYRVDVTECSEDGKYLVKQVRIAPETAVASAGADRIVECTGPEGASVTLDGTGSSGRDGTTPTFHWSASRVVFDAPASATPTASFPLGVTEVTLEVSDDAGDLGVDTVLVTVQDTVAPTVAVSLDPSVLWPPNHKLVSITADVSSTDSCSEVSAVLVGITSSEPDADDAGETEPDDWTSGDIQGAQIGVPDYEFLLRAEREGKGPGRTYQIGYAASDASGNASSTTAVVLVPHDSDDEANDDDSDDEANDDDEDEE
jgi:hypothetical protein